MTHTALFVTARFEASRLPEKMALPLGDTTTLGFLLQRIEAAKLPDLRILCTTDAPSDDALERIALDRKWQVYRGDSEDVLARYLGACCDHGIEFFVNVDGDDLMCSPVYVDTVLEKASSTRADFVHCEGLPLGLAPIGVRTEALADVVARKKETDTQGWGRYFLQTHRYRVKTIQEDWERPYRLTLDYPEDLLFFRELVTVAGKEAIAFTVEQIVDLLDQRPDIAAINKEVAQIYWERFQTCHGAFDATPFGT